MKIVKKNLFPTAQGAGKKGTAAMLCMVLFSIAVMSQSSVKVSWVGELICQEIPIDSVQVTNLTKDYVATVFYPENSITLYYSKTVIREPDIADKQIQVKPNPFSQTTEVSFYVEKEGIVYLTLYDIFGKEIASSQYMGHGKQQALVDIGGSGFYFLSVQTPTEKKTTKLLSLNHTNNGETKIAQKSATQENHFVFKLQKSNDEDFPFDLGDSIQLIAFATDIEGNAYKYNPYKNKIIANKNLFFTNKTDLTHDTTYCGDIEDLYAQSLEVIQKYIHGKWKVIRISRWGNPGVFRPNNTIVYIDTKNNCVLIDATEEISAHSMLMGGALDGIFSYYLEKKEIYPSQIPAIMPDYDSTYVMQFNELNLAEPNHYGIENTGWYFACIKDDTLLVVNYFTPIDVNFNYHEVYFCLRIKE